MPIIEPAASGRSKCFGCKGTIKEGTLRVPTFDTSGTWMYAGTEGEGRGYGMKRVFVHLRCYRSRSNQILDESYFQNFDNLNEEQKEQVLNWIVRWNEKVEAKKEKLLEKVKVPRKRPIEDSKEESSSKKKARNEVIDENSLEINCLLPNEILTHVFSYLEGPDLAIAGAVNKQWKLCSNKETLWKDLCIKKVKDAEVEKLKRGKSWKELIIYAYKEGCIQCGNLSTEKMFYPWFHGFVCRDCQQLEKYELVSKSHIRQKCGVSEKLVERCKLKCLKKTNPHHPSFAPMKLYLVSEVKNLANMNESN